MSNGSESSVHTRRYPGHHLDQVAEVYLEAAALGHRACTQAVQETWNVSHSTAAKWVARARAKGLIPPTSPGRGLNIDLKFDRVAEALGVDVQALIDAVIAHADGDLRTSRGRSS